MYFANVFRTKWLIALAFLAGILAGCQSADEVEVRTEDIGFESEQQVRAPQVKAAETSAGAENPVNALNRQGILPESITIPAVDIEANVLHLGVNEEGEMAVPPTIDEVSWFEPGYKPGENGRAVIAGHVDGLNGPAIFWDLSELSAGDEIIIEGEGARLVYRIYAMESVKLELADVEATFGYRSIPELVLITCSGEFDSSAGTRAERLIVYAELVEAS